MCEQARSEARQEHRFAARLLGERPRCAVALLAVDPDAVVNDEVVEFAEATVLDDDHPSSGTGEGFQRDLCGDRFGNHDADRIDHHELAVRLGNGLDERVHAIVAEGVEDVIEATTRHIDDDVVDVVAVAVVKPRRSALTRIQSNVLMPSW